MKKKSKWQERYKWDAKFRAERIAYAKAYYLRRKKEPKWNAARLKSLQEAEAKRRESPKYRAKKVRWMRERALTQWLASCGWSLAYYRKMVRKGCAICKKRKRLKGRSYLVRDHNHVTGKARGLLCPNCNRMVGWYEARRKVIEAYVAS